MKQLLAVLGVTVLFTGSVLAAGADVIVRERAKEIRDQNNVRQGVPPPTRSAQPPAGSSTSGTSTPQSQAFLRLQADVNAIKEGAAVAPEQKQKLANDLVATGQETKPTPAAAAKVAESLSAGLAAKALSATSRARLLQELDAVLNPSKYPQAKMPAIYTDLQAIFQDAGLDRHHAVAIVDDIKALTVH